MLALLGDWLTTMRPGPLFNPLTSSTPLSPVELLAGPFGLIVFLLLVPAVLLLARSRRRTALVLGGLAWLVLTLPVPTVLIILAGVGAATGWIVGIGELRRRGCLGRRAMVALVWIGLHALALPLWWQAQQNWYPSRMAVLHNAGFAYFLLRFIAWGVALADDPHSPLRPIDTICWLLYPPCMRLGPVLLRDEFLRRFDAWNPRQWPAWKEGARRFGLFLLGGAGLAIVGRHIPLVAPGTADFFAGPEDYTTGQLVRVFYLIPIQIYLLLWTYNELAVALSHWTGIRVDDNFHRLPLATSVRDFWRRWHITVGAWLRNYIYIPLGGNRRRTAINTLFVFAYCGIWHGASWSFMAWALSQALALAIQRVWDGVRGRPDDRRPPSRPWTAVSWLLTMHYQIATIVVFTDFDHLGWRFFRELLRRLPTCT